MRLRSWTRPIPESRRLGLIVGCAVAGGWLAGILFRAWLSPSVLGLVEAGVRRLQQFTNGLWGATRGGTGFAVSPAGHVLTNEHVIDDCESITARIDGEERALTLIATDYGNDLAVLKLPDLAGLQGGSDAYRQS